MRSNLGHRLGINYTLNVYIRSLADLEQVLGLQIPPRLMRIGEILHLNYLIPNVKKKIPTYLYRYLFEGNDFVVVRELGFIVDRKHDLIRDWVKHRVQLSNIIDVIYRKGLVKKTLFNEYLMGLLEELGLLGFDRFRGKQLVYLSYGRRFNKRKIRGFLMGLETIEGRVIFEGVQRKFVTEISLDMLNLDEKGTINTGPIPYVSEVKNFLKPEYKDCNAHKLQKTIADYLGSKYSYSIRVIESGKFHFLINKNRIPQGIVIQVVSKHKSIPNLTILSSIKQRYGLRSLGRVLVFQNFLSKPIRGWHTVFFDYRHNSWKILFSSKT